LRLDLRLIELHPELSRRKAREIIWKGQVDVDGRRCIEPGQELPEGSAVSWDRNRKAERRIRTELQILHEDPDLLVVAKPAGLLSVPREEGDESEPTLVGLVSDYVRRRDGRRARVGVVHRLDIDTTGVLVFATSRLAEERLRELFIAHRIERLYEALVVPAPPLAAGRISASISRQMIAGRRRVVDVGDPDGQGAVTHWKAVERWPAGARLEVTLETGRQHQIRIHLSHAGFPVLGDPTYYSRIRKEPIHVARPMLHARRLGFVHPTTGKKLLVEQPPPEDFLEAARRLALAKPTPVVRPSPPDDPKPGRSPVRKGAPAKGGRRPAPAGRPRTGRPKPSR
jgi:23S rRNA pseudouridine1911/1915/1917 synthase